MKKVLLSASALLLSLGFANAQLTAVGAHDDFATSTEYTNITWFVDASSNTQLSTSRTAGKMTVTGVTGSNQYAYFGVNFGANVNLSTNQLADVRMTVKNNSSQDLFLSVKLVDASGVQSEYEPDVADVTATTLYGDNTGTPNFYYHRKALNGFTLAGGATKTITIDLSSIPANLGGLNINDNDGSGTPNNCDGSHPFTCPETAPLLDPSAIVAIYLTPNFGSSDINLSEEAGNPVNDTYIPGSTIARFVGSFDITDFRLGTVTSTGISDATDANASLSVFPNPAREVLNVSFENTSGADVTLSDISGNTVYTTSAASGVNQIVVNTSNFTKGFYILNVVTEAGKVTRKVTIQ